MSVAYSWAASHGSGQLQFHLFWLAELLFLVPAIVRLLSRHASRAERLGLLVMIGLFDYLPKFLRNPSGPLFHDELAHWSQAQAIFSSSRLFVPNPLIGIIEYFPGLGVLTAALRHLTGLSTWQVGSLLLAILHVVSLVGIFVITERLTRSSMVAGIAAVIYSLNPSFMFFHSQYSYESVAIVYFVWIIACVVGVQTNHNEMRAKYPWFWIGLVLAAGCIVTHHLTTLILILALFVITGVTAARNLPPWRDRALDVRDSRHDLYLTGTYTILVLAGAGAWLLFVASGTIAYLAPQFLGGLHQIMALVRQEQQSRQLFAGSVVPSYERLAAFLTPVILALCTAGGLRLLWRNRRQARPATIALALSGLLYFASLPVMLTRTGNEGARRSWAFTYLALSVLIAPFLAALLAKARPRTLMRLTLGGVLVALFVVVLIGNVSVQVNPEYMFPGPYVYGSDTRSLTPELLGMTRWFRGTQGTNQKVLADRYSALSLAAFGGEQTASPSTSFPIWELYFSKELPGPRLLSELIASNYPYIVVDRRMSRYVPVVGFYFDPNEPGAFVRTAPPPAAAIGKYQYLPWATKIYTSDNLEVYRVDFEALRARPAVPRPSRTPAPG